MQFEKLSINDSRLLVVGPLYDKIEKLYGLQDLIQPNDTLIFLGDICYPYENSDEVVKRIHTLENFCEDRKTYYILGNYDLTFKAKIASAYADTYTWLENQNLSIRVSYLNNTNIVIFHGGLLERHKNLNDLEKDMEISFIDDKNWHMAYDGKLGYLITSHPYNPENRVEIYNHSVSLDTKAYETNILAVQEVNKTGLGKTFYL